MKRRFSLIAVLPMLLAGCAADEGAETGAAGGTAAADSGVAEAAAPDGGMGAMASTVAMSAIGDSGASGEAILTPAGGQTDVSVTLSGLEANAAHPGHIHQGSCDAIGSVVVPLSPITADASGSGTVTATAPLAADSVMAGGHIVVYHDPGGTPIVCGAVEEHVM
jgi:hypothetical protein